MTYLMWVEDLVNLTWEGKRPVNIECWELFERVKKSLTGSQVLFVWYLRWEE